MSNISNSLIKRMIVVVLMISFLCGVFPSHAAARAGTLRAGIAKIDITPDKPVKMSGYGARKALSDGVHDPLSARIIVFENDGRRLVIVSSDLIGFYGDTCKHFRKTILSEFGLSPSELLLTSIQYRVRGTVGRAWPASPRVSGLSPQAAVSSARCPSRSTP